MKSIFKKNQKTIIILIISIISLVLFCSIAYSAFETTINIGGTAYARLEKDVRVTDFKLSSSSINSTLSYEEFGINTISTKFNLLSNTSSIVFDVEVTNYGSADVGILEFIGTVPTGLSYEIINYNLKDKLCDDTGKCNGMAVKNFQIKFTGTKGEYELTQELDFRTYHTVTYTGITNHNYPTEVIDGGALNVIFKEDLKRISVLSNGTEISYYNEISNGQTITLENVSNDIEIKLKEQVAKLVSGDLNTVGSEICIKDECFYIISNDDSTVTMLSKYNLYVGGVYNNGWTAYGDEATGIQDPTMLGYVSGQTVRNGTAAFSSTTYWYSSGLKAEYGTSYPAYVYDSNSSIYNYVENYKTYLGTLGVTPSVARLITYEELESLGCSEDGWSCSEAPSWVYATSYWSGSAYNDHYVWDVGCNAYFGYDNSHYVTSRGVRPVIEMPVDDIKLPVKPVVVNGDYDTVGSEVAIGDEYFYVISSTDDTVTMLAKHNLYVGGVYNNGWTAYGDEATGIQDPKMLGYISGQSVRIGTTAFSSTNYWFSGGIKAEYGTSSPAYVYDSNSSVYNYVENYKTYLATLGVTLSEARLITYEELESLGCSGDDSSCSEAPSWVYATSYWSGSENKYYFVWYVQTTAKFDYNSYSMNYNFGVRPVITIPKSEF